MTEESFNALKFARDLAGLQADLEDATNEWVPVDQQNPAASGLLTVINELTAGTEPTTAVARAVDAYNTVRRRMREHENATDARRRQEQEELEAEEAITRKVQCPFCGVEAGLKCRGTGASGGLKNRSHRDRFRLARQLNDGATPV
ncbi:zinc finger domain-containing protein [Streptomyces sp. 1222.5]|uniref:zinc finger domain-containing protein n=1 Tax=Streptomyces sp. 1222.5 TaxID=1881026 RepID=UPI003D7430ED